MKKSRFCNVCLVLLNEENSYSCRSNNLCKKHSNEYFNNLNKIGGYKSMKQYELKNNKTEKRKQQFKETAKRMYQKYPEKWKARAKVRYAVKTGKIIKPTKCEQCSKEEKLQAHHHDYGKPLDVNWLCVVCHTKEHHDTHYSEATKPIK